MTAESAYASAERDLAAVTALDVEELRRLRSIVESSPLGVIYTDAFGIITYVNARWEEISGRSAAELIGTRDDEIQMIDDVHAVHIEEARDALIEHGEWSGQFRIWRPDGEIRHIRNWINRVGEGRDASYVSILEDVSVRTSMEGDADRLRALVNTSEDIAFILDTRGRIEYANPTARMRLGIPASVRDFAGVDATVVMRLDVHTLRVYEEQALPALAEHGHWSGRATYIDLNGQPVLTMVDVSQHRGADGRTFYTLKAHDITEHVRLAEQLARSEAWFRSIVESTAHGVVVTTEGTGIVYVSAETERMSGFRADELIGNGLLDFIRPDMLAAAQSEVARWAPDARLAPRDVQLRCADGSFIWVEISGTPFDYGSGASRLFTIRDLTQRRALEERVAQEARRFTEVVHNLGDAVSIVDATGAVIYRSAKAEELFGVDESIAHRRANRPAIVHPNDLDLLATAFRSIVEVPEGAGAPSPVVEYRMLGRDGTWRFCESTLTDLRHEASVAGVVITTRDITDRRRSERLVRDQAEFLRLVAGGAPLNTTLSTLCDLLEQYLPHSKVSMMRVEDGTLNFLAGPSIPEEIANGMRQIPIDATGAACGRAAAIGEQVHTLDIGAEPGLAGFAPVMLRAGLRSMLSTPVLDPESGETIATIGVYWPEVHDPTDEERGLVETLQALAGIAIDRKEAEVRLAHQAHHDALTGLPNRSLFTEVLQIALARAGRSGRIDAVLFVDLDRFKHVNDSLGHEAGDELLVAIAGRMRTAARAGDTISRFGGDEFTVLCEDLDPEEVRHVIADVAQRVLDVIAEPIQLAGQTIRLSGSVGVAISGPGATPGSMLRDADAAMYRAKERGKARWEIFDDELRAATQRRLEIEIALHTALERGEFLVEYQPIIDLTADRIEGLEALVRWRHPERGIVPPGDFVDLAEETGIIGGIGAFVLNEACRQVGTWMAEGTVDTDFSIAVNLSARQFEHEDIVATVRAAIDDAGIAPRQLCIEVTEGTLMANGSAEILQCLHELGVSVAIDDFGTGYSSLYYLKRFPVDVVKIDRSFVDGLGTDADDEAIVTAVLSLGHALGLRVVAEGVETEAQLDRLVGLGCDAAQGYLMSRPVPADEVQRTLIG
ncbi:MAG: EAL domain-containing protein [Actinomycetes bacterium]